MKLYELTESFAELFSQFEDINEYEPDTDADGQPIDGNGDIIEDVEAYKEKMLTAWFDTLEVLRANLTRKQKALRSTSNSLKPRLIYSSLRNLQSLRGSRRKSERLKNSLHIFLTQ